MGTEAFWKEEFGDEYHKRQGKVGSVEANISMFSNILGMTDDVRSIIEFGAGEGRNIDAISRMYPEIETTAVEINAAAAAEIPADRVIVESMLNYDEDKYTKADLVFTKGLLIHLDPIDLKAAYDILYCASERYILIAEYYNPVPVEVVYRGHKNRLWKRDFAGEMLGLYPDLNLVDYGFIYRRDEYPQDDVTWFLMEKVL